MRVLFALLLAAATCSAQTYTQRGFLENRGTFYPQEASNDRAQTVGESLFRYEGFYTPSSKLQIAGAFDFRIDTHHQVDRDWRLSWQDREIKRPLGEVRRLSATYHNGPLTFEAGKQFIRWGKTDIVTPIDRFAPRDFLTVVDNDFLAVTGARLNYEKGSNTVEAVWSPRLTPSRMPLLQQRWAPAGNPDLKDAGAVFPGGPQSGIRWNHTGAIEYEFAFYQGFNHLPSFEIRIPIVNPEASDGEIVVPPQTSSELKRFYPKMFMVGGDIAIPARYLTLKAEAARFSSRENRVADYTIYVLQIERQSGEWFFVGGYAGDAGAKGTSSTNLGDSIVIVSDFAADRGLTKALVGRAGYTIDANRNLAVETAIRQNGAGLWLKGEYSQAFGQHWRATLNLTLIRGDVTDFLGQYRLNSHAFLVLRYSF